MLQQSIKLIPFLEKRNARSRHLHSLSILHYYFSPLLLFLFSLNLKSKCQNRSHPFEIPKSKTFSSIFTFLRKITGSQIHIPTAAALLLNPPRLRLCHTISLRRSCCDNLCTQVPLFSTTLLTPPILFLISAAVLAAEPPPQIPRRLDRHCRYPITPLLLLSTHPGTQPTARWSRRHHRYAALHCRRLRSRATLLFLSFHPTKTSPKFQRSTSTSLFSKQN